METDDEWENYVSAMALGRTITFLLYSLLCSFIAIGGWDLILHAYFVGVSDITGMCVIWGILELLVIYPAAMGRLPGSKGIQTSSFSEQSAAWGLSLLSFLPWIAHATEQTFIVFNWVLNGSLVLIVAVYFIAKSLISKRLRLEVFLVLVAPILQIYIAESGVLS